MEDWINWVLEKTGYRYYDVFLEEVSEEEQEELYDEFLEEQNIIDEDIDPCDGCLKFDGSYNCKHCKHGDDGNYSIWDVYSPSELF